MVLAPSSGYFCFVLSTVLVVYLLALHGMGWLVIALGGY